MVQVLRDAKVSGLKVWVQDVCLLTTTTLIMQVSVIGQSWFKANSLGRPACPWLSQNDQIYSGHVLEKTIPLLDLLIVHLWRVECREVLTP